METSLKLDELDQTPKPTQQRSLPQEGFVRLSGIIGPGNPIPVSSSHWWAGVANGTYPKPIKIGAKITVWRVEDIRKLIGNLGGEA